MLPDIQGSSAFMWLSLQNANVQGGGGSMLEQLEHRTPHCGFWVLFLDLFLICCMTLGKSLC